MILFYKNPFCGQNTDKKCMKRRKFKSRVNIDFLLCYQLSILTKYFALTGGGEYEFILRC